MSDKASNIPHVDPEEILEGVRTWVDIETPSYDGEAVNKLVDKVESDMRAIGAEINRLPGRDGFGDILTTRTPWGGDGPGILVLSHVDTVHPIGMKDDILRWRREGDSVFGPGIYDMKAGAYLAYYAYRHLVREGKQTPLPITFMYIPEEEIGSPTSRALIEETAKQNKYVLVTEPAREGGKIVTARKGVAHFQIEATGVSAHAGSRPEDGRSAVHEIAHQIVRIQAMNDFERGVSANVGLIDGGTGINVVAASCRIEVDIRVPDAEAGEEFVGKIMSLKPVTPDVTLEITGGMNRPPFEKDEGISMLFEHAKAICADIGFELEDMKTGGGSDGNFTAALGIPTLDGLGADGVGAHAHHEQIYFSSLEPRAKMWIRLLETLE
jgi:glutamate carboxypeptidase